MKKLKHFIQRTAVVLAAVTMVFQTVPFTAFAEDVPESETEIGIETEETVESDEYVFLSEEELEELIEKRKEKLNEEQKNNGQQ